MKKSSIVRYCIGLSCASVLAVAQARAEGEVPAMVRVPPGDLGDAVESLAKQTGATVMYPGALLDGITTAGVEGALPPKEAFAKLLDGTALVVTEERGALRIAQSGAQVLPPTSAKPAAAAESPAAPPPTSPPAMWVRNELRIPCDECNFEQAMKQLLERLGATEITARPRNARFLSLAPARDLRKASAWLPRRVTHWETLTFSAEGRWRQEGTIAIAPPLYENLRTRILPLFTTRNLVERDGRITVEVLVAGEGPGAAVCHRVAQGNRIERYCGSPDQWKDLQVRVGFQCKIVGRGTELCGTASQWKRMELAAATRDQVMNSVRDYEYNPSLEANNPTNPFPGPTMGAPVNPPSPMPAPTPAPTP